MYMLLRDRKQFNFQEKEDTKDVDRDSKFMTFKILINVLFYNTIYSKHLKMENYQRISNYNVSFTIPFKNAKIKGNLLFLLTLHRHNSIFV